MRLQFLVGELVAAGFALELSLEQQALGRLAAVRVVPPGQHEEGIVVDLLFTSSGIEPEICQDAERLEIAPGLTVPVALAPNFSTGWDATERDGRSDQPYFGKRGKNAGVRAM